MPGPITIEYINGGSALTYNYQTFYDINTDISLSNCNVLNCVYVDANLNVCGSTFTPILVPTAISSVGSSNPWVLSARRDGLGGYT